jgi:hypothetical protein
VSAPVAQALAHFDRSVDTTLGSMSVASLASTDGEPLPRKAVDPCPE